MQGDDTYQDESLEELYEHAPCGYIFTRPDGAIVRVNQTFLSWTGYSRADLLSGRRLQDLLTVPGKLFYETHFAPLLRMQGVVREIALDLLRADGRRLPALVNATQKLGPAGEPVAVRITVFDATDRRTYERELLFARRAADAAAEELRRLNETLEQRVAKEVAERIKAEAALRQAQKLEAVGRLTGGVAHDFNNLLQVIQGNLQLLRREARFGEQEWRRLESALGAVERGAKLASQLLAFARRQPLEPRPFNPGRLVRGMGDLLQRALGEDIDLETIVSGGLWNAFADPVQLENAILNLAVNARDAMPDGGKLTIELGNALLDDAYAAQHAEVRAGQYVMLAVTDTGCGMSPDLVERVFEPFFTTKPEGKGTGLGLSQVFGFAKQSGGHVKIYSEVGHGTTVKLYLPRAFQAEEAVPDWQPIQVEGGTEAILVVEDDAEVRATAVDLLRDLGYQVFEASDAQAALAVLEGSATIDLLFLDVIMPGPLRSPDFARMARELRPPIKVLFTSGYTENAIVHGGRLDPGVELLSKPYSREQLARKIRKVLGSRPQSGAVAGVAHPSSLPAVQKSEGLRILLVEDDALIQLSTVDMLEQMGHQVMAASSAEKALVILDQEKVNVLITDINLPGMSGTELIHEARRRRPSLQVVIASGYGGTATTNLADGSTVPVLPKPYGIPELEKVLRSVAPV